MFFILSKLLGFVVLPSNLVVEIGLIGIVLLLTNFRRLVSWLIVTSVVLTALVGFSPLGKLLVLPLEQRFPPWDPSRGAPDGIVVLGGAIDPDLSAARGKPVLDRSGDRIIAAAELARQYPNARIVYSGGNANMVREDTEKEADYALSMLEELGVAKARLAAERLSRNTVENAEFVKTVASPKEGERWLLVTSAFHMPRSMGLFHKA